MQDEREKLRAAGFTDAEIDAELGPARPARPMVRVPAESSAMRGPGKAPARAGADLDYAKGLLRQAGQGASLGFADEIEAGARSLAGGAPYRETRDGIRADNAAFSRANPKASLAANVAGGLVTGGAAAGAAKGAGALGKAARVITPRVDPTLTLAQRLGQAAKVGGATGAIGGAGVAEEMGDVPGSILLGGTVGAAGGAALAGANEAWRGARNLAGQVGHSAPTAGPIRQRVRAETPQQAGVRRVLALMGRAGTTVDDVAAASRTADRPTALAELIPEDQGVRGLRIARNTGRRGGLIDKSLGERAADEPGRYAEAIARNTGVPEGLDATTVRAQALQKVEGRVNALYTQAYAQPDASATPILRTVEKLAGLKRGRQALERAAELSNGFDALQGLDPANPTISVQNLHHLRQGVDYALDRAVEEGDAQMVRILTGERAVLDRAAKRAGGKVFRRADRLWEQASGEGEAFALGERSQLAQTKGAMVRLKGEARDPEAFRRGAASKQVARVEAVQDGVSGQTRNPTVSTMGSPTARARASLGYKRATDFGDTKATAERIVDRLRTRQAVSGNSATARNQAELIDEFMGDPGAVAGAALSPTKMPRLLLERLLRGGAQGLSAAQADEMGRYLAAGLPGQMSREEALRQLQALAPGIANIAARRALVSGTVGGATGRGAAGAMQ